MSHRHILITLLFWALGCLAPLASAQTVPMTAMPASANPANYQQPAAKSGGFFANLEGSMRTFNAKLNTNLGQTMKHFAVNEVAVKMKQPALTIGGGLAFMYLMWECLQFYAGKRPSMLTVIFDVGVPCVVAVFLIHTYELRILQFDDMLNPFRMAHLGAGGDNPTAKLMTLYGGILADIGRALGTLFLNVVDVTELVTKPGGWFSNLADFLATLIFTFVILVLVLLGVAEVMGLLLLGPFLTAVGIAFGPLLIVGIVTPWTTDYFKKWAQFLVVSAALTGVINVILSIAASILGPNGLGLDKLVGKEPTAAGMIIVTVLLVTVNSLISQAPTIASALLPGSLGAHKGAGQGMKQAATQAANHAKSGATATAKGLATAAKKGVKMTKAADAKMYPKTP
ncbi:hypothetical protein [Massilia sp. LjRoot122]|uniref:hypothetical protein n=1 Tax=Massilia sp. LjRoot122 TaxID=3342257 RepID=UPI003ECEBA08